MPTQPDLAQPAVLDLFANVKKLRELSPNKVMYVFDDHTPANPKTLTVTSVLPAPRKGNPGTMKSTLALNFSYVIDAGKPTERSVPVVARLETSFPMGTTKQQRNAVLYALAGGTNLNNDAISNLLEKGMLPQD